MKIVEGSISKYVGQIPKKVFEFFQRLTKMWGKFHEKSGNLNLISKNEFTIQLREVNVGEIPCFSSFHKMWGKFHEKSKFMNLFSKLKNENARRKCLKSSK